MEWWLAILLGILQGLTEWLPISSSGHLVIFQYYFNEEPPILFDIILHLGSLCVIFFMMKEEIREIIYAFPKFVSNFFSSEAKGKEKMIGMIILASIPTAIIGFLFEHFGGNFPLWLAPVQVAVLPVSDKTNNYANEINKRLIKSNIRTFIDLRSDKIGAKIRNAEISRINVMLISNY